MIDWLGQFWVLQSWISASAPEHLDPPNWGAGLVHSRLRFWSPPPQVREHFSQSVQVVYPPSTGKYKDFLIIE